MKVSGFKASAFVASMMMTVSVGAATGDELKIGLLKDMSGATSVVSGESSIVAIRMAIEDVGGEVNGQKIELIVADHLNKADVALAIVREWIEVQKIDVLMGVDHSAASLAISPLAAEKNLMFLSGSSTTAMTNESCQPLQTQITIDSYGLSRALAVPFTKQGFDDWFFVTVDYALGHNLEATSIAAIEELGGHVVGSVRHPPQATDYSSFLLEAQARGAKTIGLATFSTNMVALLKQATEFGVDLPMVAYYLSIADAKALGLSNMQNVHGVSQTYGAQNDATIEFSKRFQERFNRPPTWNNIQDYEMAMNYLAAVKAAGTKDSIAVNAKFRELPYKMVNGEEIMVRADGRLARPMYMLRVKRPEESSGDWDYYEITGRVAPEDLLLPSEKSTCRLLTN